MAALQIYDRRERALVRTADAVLRAGAGVTSPFRRRRRPQDPQRILLLRLERIGDLLMVLPAIGDVRLAAPNADVHLVVGSWNADIATHIRGVTSVETLDAGWLARGSGGAGMGRLLRRALPWRKRRFDLAINFEPDVRSNVLARLSGARWTAGYGSGGGGALLDAALDYRTTEHTSENARRLVARAFDRFTPPGGQPMLDIPESHHQQAAAMLAGAARPHIAVHVSGGRPVKQWDPDRFATVARTLADRRGATIVLTGAASDRAMIDRVRSGVPSARVIDVSGGTSLLTAAAILERCDLVITGDTGPMHLAAAVGTPIVAVFGPSDPRRYAPRGPLDRVVRIDLPCAPCNRIRLPPARCVGHTPDCLEFLGPDLVVDAALAVLDARTPPRGADEPTR